MSSLTRVSEVPARLNDPECSKAHIEATAKAGASQATLAASTSEAPHLASGRTASRWLRSSAKAVTGAVAALSLPAAQAVGLSWNEGTRSASGYDPHVHDGAHFSWTTNVWKDAAAVVFQKAGYAALQAQEVCEFVDAKGLQNGAQQIAGQCNATATVHEAGLVGFHPVYNWAGASSSRSYATCIAHLGLRVFDRANDFNNCIRDAITNTAMYTGVEPKTRSTLSGNELLLYSVGGAAAAAVVVGVGAGLLVKSRAQRQRRRNQVALDATHAARTAHVGAEQAAHAVAPARGDEWV